MNGTIKPGLVDRTLENLRNAWRDIRAVSRGNARAPLRPDLPPADLERAREQIAECLEARGGEVSARARAAELGRSYLGLEPEGRFRFLQLLARDFGPSGAAVSKAMGDLAKAPAGKPHFLAETVLREALTSPRTRLFTQFTALPEGVKFLVDMRAEALAWVERDEEILAVEADLKRLFQGWFDVGFLDLAQITWNSPAAVLEKLIAYEAVHEIRSWEDLKKRLASDRRLFAFFHPRMPGEPLIFVEVALVAGMASNIQTLLEEGTAALDPAQADSAIFYSISNAQKGLAGISFGGFLIKQVVDALSQQLPRLKTFATLSPIPGFAGWLGHKLAAGEVPEGIDARALLKSTGAAEPSEALKAALARRWWEEPDLAAALEPVLMALGASYLVSEKKDEREALDPVARFHLRNGARIERLNWLADRSAKGLRQSHGLMVNYNYRLSEIEDNHEAYSAEGRIAASAAIRNLLPKSGGGRRLLGLPT